jgi:protein-tyrosine phosphatase
MTDLLLVCTANRCRSPIAEAVVRQRLPIDSGVNVESAGLLKQSMPVPVEGIMLMRRYGIDLAEHRSRPVVAQDMTRHDLVLGMTRGHVRALLALEPSAFPWTFTLKDFVRRIEALDAAETIGSPWDLLNVGRDRHSLLGDSEDDDVRDPIGESQAVWTTVIQELVDYADRLAFVLSYARPRSERIGRRTQYRR